MNQSNAKSKPCDPSIWSERGVFQSAARRPTNAAYDTGELTRIGLPAAPGGAGLKPAPPTPAQQLGARRIYELAKSNPTKKKHGTRSVSPVFKGFERATT